MRIADSHSHLHFEEYSNNLKDVIERAKKAGLEKILTVGIDLEDSIKALDLAGKYEIIYAGLGIHPQRAEKYTFDDVQKLSSLVNEKVLGIGETGFDLYRNPDSFNEQKTIFRAHIELAKEHNLPLIIHDRQAHKQTVDILEECDGWVTGGVMHCFSGDEDLAAFVLSKGFYISITGVITYKNASMLRSVAAMVPLEKLLVETDAPYLSPVPNRGKINEPAFLIETLKVLAEVKKMNADEIALITLSNFEKLFLK